MIKCPQKTVTRLRSNNTDDYFQTSYERSHYYETPVTQPLYHARVKTKLPEDVQVQKSFSENYVSVYNKTHDAKFIGYQPEYYGRPATIKNPSLKNLHEKYVKQLIKPIKSGLTTTELTYVPPKKPFQPLSLPHSSPIGDATCFISAFGRDEFPPIPPNEPGAHKHLDTFVSTTHLTHVNFTTEQRNGLPKNDVVTYYDTTEPQCHSKTVPPIGPYYSRCDIEPHPIYPKTHRAVPYKGNSSTYKTDYNHVPRIPILWQPNVRFPSIFKLSRNEVLVTPGMYCTEQSHVGSGNQSDVS